MLVLLLAQLGIAAVQAFKLSADMTGSQRLMRAHDLVAKIVFATLAVGGAIAVCVVGAFIITMLAILFAAFLQIPDANPLRGDWAVFVLAGSILVVWLAAAVHRRARSSGPDDTFSEALFSSAQLPALLVLIAMKAFISTGMLVLAMTVWMTGWWSSWIEARALGIVTTSVLGSFGAILAIHFSPRSWRNTEPRSLVDGAWIVFLSLSGLTATVLIVAVAIVIRNYVVG
jgi:hypothetical protein